MNPEMVAVINEYRRDLPKQVFDWVMMELSSATMHSAEEMRARINEGVWHLIRNHSVHINDLYLDRDNNQRARRLPPRPGKRY